MDYQGHEQLELIRLPQIGERWTPGGGHVCEVYNAWYEADGNGVVVRWMVGGEPYRSYFTVSDFFELMEPVDWGDRAQQCELFDFPAPPADEP